jgi:superfamily II DNA helicase RecQ
MTNGLEVLPMTPTVRLTPAQQIILFVVRRLPGQLGRSEMAKLLAGSKSKRLEAWHESPHYGRLRDYNRQELTAQLDILLQQRLLAVDSRQKLIPVLSDDPEVAL